jgi:hypothetical protein
MTPNPNNAAKPLSIKSENVRDPDGLSFHSRFYSMIPIVIEESINLLPFRLQHKPKQNT